MPVLAALSGTDANSNSRVSRIIAMSRKPSGASAPSQVRVISPGASEVTWTVTGLVKGTSFP